MKIVETIEIDKVDIRDRCFIEVSDNGKVWNPLCSNGLSFRFIECKNRIEALRNSRGWSNYLFRMILIGSRKDYIILEEVGQLASTT